MSLINDVLRNLETRDPLAADLDSPLEGLEAPPLRRQPRGSGLRAPAQLVLGVLLGMGGLLVWENAGPDLFRLPARVRIEPTPAAPEREAALLVRAPQPRVSVPELHLPRVSLGGTSRETGTSRVRGLLVDAGERRTRLTLDLSREAMYSIETHPPGEQVHILLANAVLTEPPPPTDLSRTPIRAIHARPVDGDLSIRLDLDTPVRTQSTMLARDESAALVVDLFPEPPAPASTPPPVASPPRGESEKIYLLPKTPAKPPRLTAKRPALASHSPQRTADSERAEHRYGQALELLASGDAAGALTPLREALAYDPFHHPSRETLASILVQLGELDRAGHVVAVGQRLQPGSTSFAQLRARILMRRGAPAAALAALKRSPPPVEHDPEYHALMAALYQQERQYALATGKYRRLLEVEPDKTVWWLGLGISLEGAGHTAEALVAYRAAAALGGLGTESSRYVGARISALEGGRR